MSERNNLVALEIGKNLRIAEASNHSNLFRQIIPAGVGNNNYYALASVISGCRFVFNHPTPAFFILDKPASELKEINNSREKFLLDLIKKKSILTALAEERKSEGHLQKYTGEVRPVGE